MMNNTAMAEALRLTQAGRLTEATALLQGRLASGRAAEPDHAPATRPPERSTLTNNTANAEALRLTLAGCLTEATALLQGRLASGRAAEPDHAPATRLLRAPRGSSLRSHP